MGPRSSLPLLVNAAEALRSSFPNGRPKALTEALLVARSRIDPSRPFPDLLIIGGQRCGTSSLYKYLGAHPLVIPSLRKEIRYLNRHHAKGEAWYRAHFASRWHRSLVRHRQGGQPLTFEATPAYLFHPLAAGRAAALVPEARIVAMLRSPVDRACSHYHHSVRRGWETLPFEDAIAAEPSRLAGIAERLAADPDAYDNDYLRYSYLARGFYADQLEPWLARYPREQVLVLRSEDFFSDPVLTYHRLLDFLQLPRWVPPRLGNHSYGGAAKPARPDLDSGLRRRLVATFGPHNERLETMLGQRMGWDH